jgi:hypothetical protein
MHKKVAVMAIGIAAFAMSAAAQIQTSGTTTVGTIPVFGPDSTATVTNSPISVSGGNVGISQPVVVNGNIESILDAGFPTLDVAGVVSLGLSGPTGARNWALRGVYQYWNGVGQNAAGGDLDLIKSWNGNSILGTKTDGTPLGNVGIGTASPSATLDVNGTLSLLSGASSNVAITPQGDIWSPGVPRGTITFDAQWNGSNFLNYSDGANNGATIINSDAFGNMYFRSISSSGNSNRTLTPAQVASYPAMTFGSGVLSVSGNGKNAAFFIGNVGIGTTTPGAKLEVSGNILLTSGSGASITFPDGTKQGTAWTGMTCGGDYAESVDVSGDRTNYEPGDVLVIDPNAPGKILKSVEPYSTLVSGIYSTKPGVVGRRQAGDPKNSTTEIPMAMVGIVPTKVSTENGPIRTGDLLVASATMGHAMKGTDRSRMLGAVIGKAFGNLDSGTGVIEVLVTLQ